MKRSLYTSETLNEEEKQQVLNELKLGYLNLEDELFEQAKLNFDLVLQIDKTNADAYWGLMLVKFQLKSEELLHLNAMAYKSAVYLPEYQKAMQYALKIQKETFENTMKRINQINAGDNY